MLGSKEDEGSLLGGGARALGLGGGSVVVPVGGKGGRVWAGLDARSHQSGGLEAEWGQALEEGGLPPYVTGHVWLH